MKLHRKRRGALEGLPLYLIILVVVAAVVIVILLGWLSSLSKPQLGTPTFVVANTYTSIYSNGAGTGDATFTASVAGECIVTVPGGGAPGSAPALTVNTYDTHSNRLNGVIVGVVAGNGILNLTVSPNAQETSGSGSFSAGAVQFASLLFSMAPNSNTGIIHLQFSYSGGIATSNPTLDISVSAPSGMSC